MYADLKQHLSERFPALSGSWIGSKNAYEAGLCQALGFDDAPKKRYWDAVWNGHRIECKKGRSIWLDLVRYSEILLKVNSEAACETVTLFFVPDSKASIGRVACVRTCDLIAKLGLDAETAHFLIALNDRMPRSLNAQASLTVKDICGVATFVVPEPVSLDDLLQ